MAAAKGCIKQLPIQFNCGFARVAVCEITKEHRVKFKAINKCANRTELSRKFQSLYDSCPNLAYLRGTLMKHPQIHLDLIKIVIE